jgi:hypothetical protein
MKHQNYKKLFSSSILFAFFLFAALSCNTRDEENVTSILLKPQNKALNLSSFTNKIEYISLNTPKGKPLGKIINIDIFNNLIFVYHSLSKSKLSVFNAKGEYLYNIGKMGRGPEEYVSMQDFTVDKKKNQVLIMDLGKQKIHYYKMNGEFLKTENLPVHALGFSSINNGLIFYVGNLFNNKLNANTSTLYNIYEFDSSLNEKGHYLEVPKLFKGITQGSVPSSLSLYEDGINIIQPLNNYIYYYNKGQVKKRFYLDFGSLKCDFKNELKQYKGNPSTFTLYLSGKNYSFSPERFFEFENMIYFDFNSKNKTYNVFYDKEKNRPHIGNKIIDDLNHGLFGTPIAHWKDKLVTIIDPYKLLELKKLPEGFKNLNITEESNPVLAFFTINATPQNMSN